MNLSDMRWQAQFVLYGGMALLLLSNIMSGRIAAIGQLIWNG